MAQLVTMVELEARVRSLANMETGGPVTSVEIRQHLLMGLARVRDELLAAGQEIERSSYLFDTTPGVSLYPMPSDFYRLLAVMMASSRALITYDQLGRPVLNAPTGASWCNLDPFEVQEKASLMSQGAWGYGPGALRYRQGGTSGVRKLELLPVPQTVWCIQVEYITPLTFSTSSDAAFDGLNGFEQIAVLEAAAYCLAKEETDNSHLMLMAQSEWQRLRDIASSLDRGRPARTVDVTGATDVWGYGSLGLGGRGWL